MLTGKHSFVNGKVDNVQPFNWDQPNFAKLLQSSGYQTALIGKIHLHGAPQGFDYSAVLPGQGHYYNPDFIENGDTITTNNPNDPRKWLIDNNQKRPFPDLQSFYAFEGDWTKVKTLSEDDVDSIPEGEPV